MIERFHGIDRHKRFSTISMLNREGQELRLIPACTNLKEYIEALGPEDAVVMEASTGAFWWADQAEAKGALCFILDPHNLNSRTQRNTRGVLERRKVAEALPRSCVQSVLQHSNLLLTDQRVVGFLGPFSAAETDRVLDAALLP